MRSVVHHRQPEVVPGAARWQEIRKQDGNWGLDVLCSPNRNSRPSLVSRAWTKARAHVRGVLDPLGAGLTPGPDLYVALIEKFFFSGAWGGTKKHGQTALAPRVESRKQKRPLVWTLSTGFVAKNTA